MYFLAIVSHEDLLNGNIVPSYILHWSLGTSKNRSPWRVYRCNTSFNTIPKVLVKYPFGNDAMIDFLSAYRTRDHIHNTESYKAYIKSKKYYPEGALFWFECNEYGEVTGPAVFVKRIPDQNIGKSDYGMHRLAEFQKQLPSVNVLFSRDPFAIPLINSGTKPKLAQSYGKG